MHIENDQLHQKSLLGKQSVDDNYYYKDEDHVDLEEEQNWIHICAAIDTCTQYEGTKFYNEDGEKVATLCMLNAYLGPQDYMQPLRAVSIRDLSNSDEDSSAHETE